MAEWAFRRHQTTPKGEEMKETDKERMKRIKGLQEYFIPGVGCIFQVPGSDFRWLIKQAVSKAKVAKEDK